MSAHCDFSLTSYCAMASNINTAHGNPTNFIYWQQQGFNHPTWGGCNWFNSAISNWTGILANVTGVAYRRMLIAQIDWARCQWDVCCGGPPITYGCMDDGTKGNDYINNQGTLASPQYGSVLPPIGGIPQAASNYHITAQIDNGTCFYVPIYMNWPSPFWGCKDPTATNYDPNANMDCNKKFASPFNLQYTWWGGTTPAGTLTPYGNTSCCNYASGDNSKIYDYRMQNPNNPGGIKLNSQNVGGSIQYYSIGGQILYFDINRFDIVGNETFLNFVDAMLKMNPYNTSLPYGQVNIANNIQVKVYSIEEDLLWDGVYAFRNGHGFGSCPAGSSGEHCQASGRADLLTENFSISPGNIIDLEPYGFWTYTYVPPNISMGNYNDGSYGGTLMATGPAGYVEFKTSLAGKTVDKNNITVHSSGHNIAPSIPSPLAIPRGTTGDLIYHWTGDKRVQASGTNPVFPGNYAAGQIGFVWPHSCTDCGSSVVGQPLALASHRNMIQYPLVTAPIGSTFPFIQDPTQPIPGDWYINGAPSGTYPVYNNAITALCSATPLLPPDDGNGKTVNEGLNIGCVETKHFIVKSNYIKDDNHTVNITPDINIDIT